MNRYIVLFLSAIFLSSCNRAGSGDSTETTLFPITNNVENPSSIFLKLMDRTEGDTTISYAARGLYHSDTVGLVIEVSKDIPAGINADGSANEEIGFNKGWITFKSSGAESDRFISALAELWQVNDIEKMTSSPIQPLTFSSNKTAVNHDKPATSSFKLFFDEASNTPGEIFFTFDTYRRSIEFQEKDQRYRSTIVRTFAE